jgi:hypothetical protein
MQLVLLFLSQVLRCVVQCLNQKVKKAACLCVHVRLMITDFVVLHARAHTRAHAGAHNTRTQHRRAWVYVYTQQYKSGSIILRLPASWPTFSSSSSACVLPCVTAATGPRARCHSM